MRRKHKRITGLWMQGMEKKEEKKEEEKEPLKISRIERKAAAAIWLDAVKWYLKDIRREDSQIRRGADKISREERVRLAVKADELAAVFFRRVPDWFCQGAVEIGYDGRHVIVGDGVYRIYFRPVLRKGELKVGYKVEKEER